MNDPELPNAALRHLARVRREEANDARELARKLAILLAGSIAINLALVWSYLWNYGYFRIGGGE